MCIRDRKKEASLIAEQINGKEYSVKKLSTENKELYGSVKPTEIAKLIQDENKIEIKPSMIQPVEEIKALGKFKVKISLHSEVDAEILYMFLLQKQFNNYTFFSPAIIKNFINNFFI